MCKIDLKYILVIFIPFFFLKPAFSAPKTIDRIEAVFNSKIFTLSEIDRIKKTLKQRKELAGPIYSNVENNVKSISNLLVDVELIRNALKEIGYVIDDEKVESSINQRQKFASMTRDQLVSQLKAFNITFDEYFEIIRASIEYNLFQQRIIRPLVSISEQEVKNYFFDLNKDNKSITYKYELINFKLPANFNANQVGKKKLHNDLSKIISKKHFENYLKGTDLIHFDSVTQDTLTLEINSALKNLPEKSFSKIISIDGTPNIFYIKSKNITESTVFKSQKPKLKDQLIAKQALDIEKSWKSSESLKHFIKFF